MTYWGLAALAFTLFRPIEGLPPEAPRDGTIITIDVSTNQAYLFRDGVLLKKSSAATGAGAGLAADLAGLAACTEKARPRPTAARRKRE